MTALQPLLRQHDFRALLGARLTNGLAFSALATVVGFQVYEITRDPLALGFLGLVEAIPALSLVLFGGHVADRYDRRTIILVTSAPGDGVRGGPRPAVARPGVEPRPDPRRHLRDRHRQRLRTPGSDRLRGAGDPARAGRPGCVIPGERQPDRLHHRTRTGWHRRGGHRGRRGLRPDRRPCWPSRPCSCS